MPLPLLLIECKERECRLMEATLSSKGQATIPKAVRDRLQITPGTGSSSFHPDGVIILPKISTARLKGMIPKPAQPVSLEESIGRLRKAQQKDFGEENDWSRYEHLLRYLRKTIQRTPPCNGDHRTALDRTRTGLRQLGGILEVAWVLKSLFKRSRQEIANDIEMLLAADTLEVQNEQEVYYAVVSLRNGIGTFEDALIGSSAPGEVVRLPDV